LKLCRRQLSLLRPFRNSRHKHSPNGGTASWIRKVLRIRTLCGNRQGLRGAVSHGSTGSTGPAGEAIRIEVPGPPRRMSQSAIVPGDPVLFSCTRLQNQAVLVHLPHYPILVDFVRVHVAVGRRTNIFSPWPWGKTVLFTGVYHPVVHFKSKIHGRTPDGPKDPVSQKPALRTYDNPSACPKKSSAPIRRFGGGNLFLAPLKQFSQLSCLNLLQTG